MWPSLWVRKHQIREIIHQKSFWLSWFNVFRHLDRNYHHAPIRRFQRVDCNRSRCELSVLCYHCPFFGPDNVDLLQTRYELSTKLWLTHNFDTWHDIHCLIHCCILIWWPLDNIWDQHNDTCDFRWSLHVLVEDKAHRNVFFHRCHQIFGFSYRLLILHPLPNFRSKFFTVRLHDTCNILLFLLALRSLVDSKWPKIKPLLRNK